jgi:hypothetical protein
MCVSLSQNDAIAQDEPSSSGAHAQSAWSANRSERPQLDTCVHVGVKLPVARGHHDPRHHDCWSVSSVIAPLLIDWAGGAGIAPFKGFLEEREERMKASTAKFGPFELYYGNRDPTEYAYGPELAEASRLRCRSDRHSW